MQKSFDVISGESIKDKLVLSYDHEDSEAIFTVQVWDEKENKTKAVEIKIPYYKLQRVKDFINHLTRPTVLD
jgi:hypothetical protein